MVNVEVLFAEVLVNPNDPELQSELLSQVVSILHSYFLSMSTFICLATCRCHGG